MGITQKLLIALLCGLFFAACTREKPDASVNGFFNALKDGNLRAAEGYLDAPIFAGVQEGDETLFLQTYFKTVTYEKPIIESIENASAKVGVTVSAVDLDHILANFMQTMQKRSAEDNKSLNDYSESELNNMILDPLKDPASPRKTIKLSLDLHRLDGKKWTISANEHLHAGLFMRSTEHTYENPDEYSGGRLSQDISATATQVGINEGVCKFKINGKDLPLHCAEYSEFLKERVGTNFQILYRAYTEPGESEEAYWLVGFE
jgi:hypothetical protein